jgi:spermidine synthase
MAAEAIWTRMLGLLFGASVYAMSIIVAVFLTGLGIGSTIGSLLCRTVKQPRVALGWCQLLGACAIAWSAYSLSASLPYWPINPSTTSSVWFNFQIDLDRAFRALLPPTLLWGASFPFALASVRFERQDAGRLMGAIYAANTVGAIAGAVGASLLLIKWIGSQRAEQLLIGLSVAAGLLILLQGRRTLVSSAAAVLVAALMISTVPPVSKVLIAYGRYASTWVGKSDIIYAHEGLNSSVAVSDFAGGARTFHVAGKIQASNVPRDMRLQRMLGHLTSLTAAHARSVLVIGCGAGITAGAVSIDPSVEQTTIVEIEPLVPQAASAYFARNNFDVIHNPKVQVRIDDGRHYLLTSKTRFDAITADPLDPWVKGAANLYTREFFETVKQHLNSGGVVTMYIQLFETNLDAVKSAVATFFEVFPNGTIWGNTYKGRGHDMVLLGQAEPMRIDLDEMEHRLSRPEYSRVMQSLGEIGMHSAVDLFATYAGRGSDLTEWLKGAAINRDRNLRMQYLAGTGLDVDDSAAIYAGMLRYRRFPGDIFGGTSVNSLRQAIDPAYREDRGDCRSVAASAGGLPAFATGECVQR